MSYKLKKELILTMYTLKAPIMSYRILFSFLSSMDCACL